MTTAIEWRNVVKVFGSGGAQTRALAGVTLAVRAGEFVAVMGPSASGKSTLLHLAGGLEEPTAGQVVIDGQDLADLRPAALASLRRRRVGYVFQKLNLVGSLTAIENVALPLELDGVSPRPAKKTAEEALRRVGLEPPFDRYPDDLSGGEQQRVAIARAVVGPRDVLLADEPTGALDTLSADSIVELLAEVAGDGAAVVLVTHDPRLASYADRIVFLRDGAIVDEATPASVSTTPSSATT